MLGHLLREAKRVRCVFLHWTRDRDSLGTRCRTCGERWG